MKNNNKPLRILHVTGTMNRGGAEVMLMDLFRHKSKDVVYDFLVNRKRKDMGKSGDFDQEILSNDAKIFYIGTQFELGPVVYILHFRKIVKKIKPNIVHIHLNAKSGIIALAARLSGVKRVIVHCHADIRFRGPKWKVVLNNTEMFFQKILISFFATDFWGCSVEANKRLYWGYLQPKTVVINNAIDVDAFLNISEIQVHDLRKSYKANNNILILGNVGRIVRHKNIIFLLDLLKELNNRKIVSKLVIAGRIDDQKYFEEFMTKAKNLKIDQQIIYIGDRDDIPVVMSTFDVFVGPALREGFGLVAVEAQAAGVPCVLNKGFPSSVDMGLNLVIFISNFNLNEWADKVLSQWKNKCTDKKLIKNHITNNGYDVSSNVKVIENLYKS